MRIQNLIYKIGGTAEIYHISKNMPSKIENEKNVCALLININVKMLKKFINDLRANDEEFNKLADSI